MEVASQDSTTTRADLPAILILAVVQGWALYGLHHSISAHQWPATEPAWLLGLYALAVFVPVTLQLLIEHRRKPALWASVAVITIALFYFGWHHGGAVADPRLERFAASGEYFPLALVLLVWWLHLLPFIQNRLTLGAWRMDYALLCRHAWRNVIGLAEAALFTGLLWLILGLWQALFHMLGIDFFTDLFAEPIFIYPVTAVAFGCALHLIGSIDVLVSAVLEQVLNVLKWLAVVAGALLTFFTIALLLKLPHLVFSGERAIGATWLLWLVAVVVLFLNAAYRDGTAERVYPKAIALGLRACVPLLVVVAVTALYALIVRSQHYGLTVQRVWAFVVAGAALIYSVGYSVAAFAKGRWLGGIARVNVAVALALVAAIGAALTPVLSPYRLAADSQFRLILAGKDAHPTNRYLGQTSFVYLRFNAGRYGRSKLEQLSNLQNHLDADRIRGLAAQALKQSYPWEFAPNLDAGRQIARLAIYPQGHVLDAALAKRLVADLSTAGSPTPYMPRDIDTTAGLFADLNGDGVEEFILLGPAGGPVYSNRSGQWLPIGRATPRHPTADWRTTWDVLHADLSRGAVSTPAAQWQDLSIGTRRFRIDADD